MLRASIALDELERVDGLRADGEGLRLAGRIGLAVNAPKELHGEHQRLKSSLTLRRWTGRNQEQEAAVTRDIQKALRVARRRARAMKRQAPQKG